MNLLTFPRLASNGLRIFGLAAFALLIFVSTALVFAGLTSLIFRLPITGLPCITTGVTCGLIAWLFWFAVNLNKETINFSTRADETELHNLSCVMTSLGYVVHWPTEDKIVGRPSFTAILFGGSVRARLRQGVIQLTGPKVSLEKIRRQLRLENHVSRWNIDLNAEGLTEENKSNNDCPISETDDEHDSVNLREVM